MLDARAESAELHGMEAQVPVSLMRWFPPERIATDGWAVRYARACVRRDRVEDWAASWRATARLDILDRLPQITVSAIAIAGEQDSSATPETMRQTAAGISGCDCSTPART
ncbi:MULTISPECIES: hypothetical protein [unclassified Streptomyces]|uniref:alpha/beta fold hydrolase n=1 Tax=unclassified Streptomyces TaxID=2593676 RepID=UPI00131A913D|nr:hypothetical protein [Streptomyces sp. CB01635]